MIETFFDNLTKVAGVFGSLSAIAVAAVAFIKPVRDKVLGLKRLRDGMKCILRYNMLDVYYKNRANKTVRQYDLENFCSEYSAYKALGGNSFIDKVYDKVTAWESVE